MARITIIIGHARRDTFCEALGDAYRDGARAVGHEVEFFALARMRFDPILHDGFHAEQPLEPALQDAQTAIGWADHLVWIWPLWMGTMPAIQKGFIERVFQPGFAFPKEEQPNPLTAKLLKGRSARLIVTMGMPAMAYRLWYGAHAVKMMRRNILGFVGIGPVRTTLYGMIDAVDDAKRKRWLSETERLGKRAR